MSSSIDYDLTVAKVVTDPRWVGRVQPLEVRREPAFDPTWLPTVGDRAGDLIRDRRHHGDVLEGSR